MPTLRLTTQHATLPDYRHFPSYPPPPWQLTLQTVLDSVSSYPPYMPSPGVFQRHVSADIRITIPSPTVGPSSVQKRRGVNVGTLPTDILLAFDNCQHFLPVDVQTLRRWQL